MEVVRSIFFGSERIPGRVNDPAAGDPVSEPEETAPPSPPLTLSQKGVYRVKLVLFAVLWLVGPVCAVALGAPATILLAVKQHTWFRMCMRAVERAFASLVPITATLFMPNSYLVITGDWMQMSSSDKTIVMSNHQIYPDWVYLWLLAWFRNCHADFRVMMIKVLALIPFMGQGMQLFEFILLNQKADKDLKIIADNLSTARNDVGLPLWMLIFPEGTLNTPGNIVRSKKYAEKMGISNHPNHCILPKSLGLFHSIENLRPKDLFDVTVGYSGVRMDQVPYNVLLPDKVFLEDGYPRQVHIHVARHRVPEIPGFLALETSAASSSTQDARKTIFDAWLKQVWKEKDDRLHEFYLNGDMCSNVSAGSQQNNGSDHRRIVPLVPRGEDYMYFSLLVLAGYLLVPLYLKAGYWTVLFALRLVYVAGWFVLSLFGFSRLTLWVAVFALLGWNVGGLEDMST
ncbi:hypothetical protein CcCBS67573_g04192 [Chytriomyces confervae]|uniref:Phospholipid/glycerol acyltransferase domain-containing protein n=1 Tax=Chytriomyces confervae TaxID=246404 RepID=A0A507FGY1_9FUNG|nr:hypothetical protein HDU80_007482 [Chytriomyces hyalinus]TPX74536.1 hypothetical protein CcCBS67573_g04192 [Chytriomyces confervae]